MCKKAAGSIAGAIANPIGAITGGIAGSLLGGGGGSIPNVPDPRYLEKIPMPEMTQQEKQSLERMGINIDQLNKILSGEYGSLQQNQNILRSLSGIYDQNGNVNQGAVNSLRQLVQSTQQQENQLNQNALNQLQGTLNPTQLETASDAVGMAEIQRLNDALSGNLSPSNAIMNQEKSEFARLKEAAGQRGIKIEGNDLYGATSQSTAGNQLLNDLRSNFSARRDTERQNIINQSTSSNLNRLGFGLNRQNQVYNQAQGLRSDPSSQALGFMRESQTYSPATLSPYYSNLNENLMNYASPYANQRMTEYKGDVNTAQYNNQLRNAQITGNYNRDLQGYQNKQDQRNAIFGTVGTIGGALVGSLAGPGGAAVGSQVGNRLMTQGGQGGGMGFNRLALNNPYSPYGQFTR